MNDMNEYLLKHGIEYKTSEPLSKHSSFKIGGKADIAIFPKNENELALTLCACASKGIKYTVIGNATNVLFSDKGYRGAIIFTKRFVGVEIEETDDGAYFAALCGTPLAHIANLAAERGYSGFEFLHGIPATLGGAVYMNAGAFGFEIADVLKSVRVYDVKNNTFNDLLPNALELSYRHSKLMDNESMLCVSAKLFAKKGDVGEIRAKMEDFKQRRLSSQPYTAASAGSYFKRPDGYFAAKLIDDCGLKGLRVGNAEVSKKHAGFIINIGGASAADVLDLASRVAQAVREKYGVSLESEVRYIEE